VFVMKSLGFDEEDEEGEEDMLWFLKECKMENLDLCVRLGHVGMDGPCFHKLISSPNLCPFHHNSVFHLSLPHGSIHILHIPFFFVC